MRKAGVDRRTYGRGEGIGGVIRGIRECRGVGEMRAKQNLLNHTLFKNGHNDTYYLTYYFVKYKDCTKKPAIYLGNASEGWVDLVCPGSAKF